MRFTTEQYERLTKNKLPKQNKYKNIITEYDGIKFDSKKEKETWVRLKTMEKFGIIKDVQRQIKYQLLPAFKLNGKSYRETSYYADFTFVSTQDDKIHVVDVKSRITAKNDVYRLKKKLMAYRYGIEIEEI